MCSSILAYMRLFMESLWMSHHFFCLSSISGLEGGRGKSSFCHHAQGGVKPLNHLVILLGQNVT